jgi:hypothetical protein
MLSRMLGGTTPDVVAQSYEGLADVLVVDEADAGSRRPTGMEIVVTPTLMHDREAARRLAERVLEAACA